MRVTVNQNVLFHQYGEEAVLLNLDTESYFSLNETAIRMWELVTTHSFDEAAAIMAEEYDAPVEIIRDDMRALVDSLQRANLVTVNEQAA
jgi:Coenzyme PQQ synthesis protein D (PqqD)